MDCLITIKWCGGLSPALPLLSFFREFYFFEMIIIKLRVFPPCVHETLRFPLSVKTTQEDVMTAVNSGILH